MNAPALAGDDVISKAEFARRRRVTPGRVSQWIAEGKISGEALVGEGRGQQIREAAACAQLRRRLDVTQSLGNGLATQLTPRLAEAEAANTNGAVLPFPTPEASSVEDRIKQQRLEQLERQNREGRRQEALDSGRLTETAGVRAHQGRMVARLIGEFDGTLSAFATAIAAEFKLPQRDLVHLLRREFRKFRADQARALREMSAALPDSIDVVLADEPGAANIPEGESDD